jgi:hypothetical protein
VLALYGMAVAATATWRRLAAWRFRRADRAAAATAAALDVAQGELSTWALRLAGAAADARQDMAREAAVARLEADEAAARYRKAQDRVWRLRPRDWCCRGPGRPVLPYLAGLADGGGLALLAYWRQGGNVARLATDLLFDVLSRWFA